MVSYHRVKEVREYVYFFQYNELTWQTDRHRTMAQAALCIALRGKK